MSAPYEAPRSAVDLIAPGALPPEDLDPLAEGILMKHQAAWLADHSPLKLAEKGRRTGITFAEALDSTLIAMSTRSAGGDNTWYIGDTKDKGLEFCAVCARFAKAIAKELVAIEEFVFDDQQDDGSSRAIAAYRIRFKSGFQIAALSSRPANIRGLQGRVVIDEAAFHPNVRGVIDACNALLIWGGTIRIISTHNGATNAFNELIREARAGRYDYSIHTITFDDAVENGLYERVCLIKGWKATPEGKAEWYNRVRRSFGNRTEAMREELDAIPREGDGVAIPLAWIEACSRQEHKVLRWSPPAADFVDWAEERRRASMQAWIEEHLAPELARLPNVQVSVGGDFAMRQDRSAYPVGYVGQQLQRVAAFIVELRQCPYDQQKQVLFWIITGLRKFNRAVLDANGNGMVLAQEARQRFGADRVIELMPNDVWFREVGPKFRAAFEDRTIEIPADLDVRDDLRQLREARGIIKVPSDVRTEGTDGGRRHADTAVALMNFFSATLDAVAPIESEASGRTRSALRAFEESAEGGGLFGDDRAREDRGFGTVAGMNDFQGFA
jgi:phage FluMu gp28-like protein